MRVLIVEDHKIFAEAVRSLLERRGEDVVAIATGQREALEAMERHAEVDVVLLDMRLPDGDGISTGVEILLRWPDTRIIAVTALTSPKTASEAMAVGFHGYLTKDLPLSRFVEALTTPLKGGVVIPSPPEGRRTTSRVGADERHAGWLASQLTAREWDVLALLVEGKSSKDIARYLDVSPNTVRSHIQNILIKLQVHSRVEAVSFAVRHRLVPRQRWA